MSRVNKQEHIGARTSATDKEHVRAAAAAVVRKGSTSAVILAEILQQ